MKTKERKNGRKKKKQNMICYRKLN